MASEAIHGRNAIELASALEPDVVVMDFRMPAMDGIEATRRIGAQRSQTSVIALTMHRGQEEVEALRLAGASDCVAEGDSPERLFEAIRRTRASAVVPVPS